MKKDQKGKQTPEKNADDLLNYPPGEDITRNRERAEIDPENMSPIKDSGEKAHEEYNSSSEEDDLEFVPGTEADVTEEDLVLLGPEDRDLDMGEDEQLESQRAGLNPEQTDLDIPGAELDDENEEIGEEDEENNYYSLGDDQHDGDR